MTNEDLNVALALAILGVILLFALQAWWANLKLNRKIAALEAKISTLQTQANVTNGNLSATETRLRSLTNTVTSLEQDLNAIATQFYEGTLRARWKRVKEAWKVPSTW